MLSRQALLASAASLLMNFTLQAQVPKTPTPPPAGAATAQIIPVSFRNDQVAATVNGEKILVGEVRKLLDSKLYALSLTEEQKKMMRKAALDQLVEDVLMRQYLSKHVPKVNQSEFNKEMAELQDILKKQNKTLPALLQELNQSDEELRRDIISRLQWRNLLQRFLPDDKAKAYYDTNKVFFDKVMVRASHIMIKMPTNATKEQRDRANQTLLVWRQEIVAGKAKFDDVARQYSDCDSKVNGGDIGKITYLLKVVPEFAQAAFTMRVGEISGVVTTDKGMHLIMVTERTPGEPSSFEAIKDAVREIWAEDQKLIPRVLDAQRASSDIKLNLP